MEQIQIDERILDLLSEQVKATQEANRLKDEELRVKEKEIRSLERQADTLRRREDLLLETIQTVQNLIEKVQLLLDSNRQLEGRESIYREHLEEFETDFSRRMDRQERNMVLILGQHGNLDQVIEGRNELIREQQRKNVEKLLMLENQNLYTFREQEAEAAGEVSVRLLNLIRKSELKIADLEQRLHDLR